MRMFTGVILFFCCAFAWAQQTPTPKRFVFPKNVTTRDYQPGKVLVKVNPSHKTLFQRTAEASGRKASLLQSTGISSLAPKGNVTRTAARMAFKPSIDIGQYFEMSFDPAIPVDDYINRLYASGYVELAEPVYKASMQFTPNDPSFATQYYLTKIKATEAWNITQGSEDIVIAIVDSGVDMDHPDFANQFYINQAEATGTTGVDDDGNGYIDDIRGWDFSGADTLNAFNPNFAGDNDPAIYKGGSGFTHGTQVGGCAGAATNNGIGIAGVGYKTKLLFTKHFADNQKTSDRNYNSDTYRGVLYAAYQGAKIINCSWGGNVRSQVYQDFINFITNDLGCLVVGAAGNSNSGSPIYPASYDNVISVAATDQNDVRGSFSNYGSYVDLSAPGVAILTTAFDNSYATPQGTSFSSPIVAGAAALVWTMHPEFTPQQVAEQLRVSADVSMYDQNPSYINKLGKGRLDILQALTISSPSIRASKHKLVNASGATAGPGDEAFLSFDFKNVLQASSAGLEISISSSSTNVTITQNKINPGSIAAGATMSNALTPFRLTLNAAIAENEEIDLLIKYTDGAYQDFQLFTFIPNPTFIDIDNGTIITTISAAGRLAYEEPATSGHGSGFLFNDQSLVYDMGLLMGSSEATLLNNIRGATSGSYDQDFVKTDRIREIVPGLRSDGEIFGAFSNSATPTSQQVVVSYRSMKWHDAPNDHFVIVEYKIKNTQATDISNFRVGLFADWDINVFGGDGARWDNTRNLGYTFPKNRTDLPYAGIQVLTGNAHFFAIDNNGNGSFSIYDGFQDNEKFSTLSTTRLEAGASTNGGDVSQVVSAGPFTITAGQEITIAFALHAAPDLVSIQQSADAADMLYNFTLKEQPPIVTPVEVCYGTNATLKATGATKYRWYKDFTGGTMLLESDEFTVPNVKKDTTLYVSNATNPFESIRTAAVIKTLANPTIHASRDLNLCKDDAVTLSVVPASSYAWNTGATTQQVNITQSGAYRVTVKYDNNDTGVHCESTSADVVVTVRPRPVANIGTTTPEVLYYTDKEIVFNEASEGAISWHWDFNDGITSNLQKPKHTYATGNTYVISLTVTASNGCQDTDTRSIAVVTHAETDLDKSISVYPVPLMQAENLSIQFNGVRNGAVGIEILASDGRKVYEDKFLLSGYTALHTVPAEHLSNGLYLVRLHIDEKIVVKKISVVR